MRNRFVSLAAIAVVSVSLPLSAQKVYTAQDYSQAERWMSYNVHGLVHGAVSRPEYLKDGRVFYRVDAVGGTQYMLADPAKGATAPAFDNAKLAAAMTAAGKNKFEASRVDVSEFATTADGFTVTTSRGKFACDVEVTKCVEEVKPPAPIVTPEKAGVKPPAKVATTPVPQAPPRRRARGMENVSPDKKLAAFIRDNDLWIRILATGEERELTTDGVADFGYATDNAGWQHTDAAIVTWSADSKMIATFQQDQRKTESMYLVPTVIGHPKLEAWKYPLVGDKNVTMIEPVVIDVTTGKMVRVRTAPLEHRSMECDDVSCGDGKWTDAEFSPDDKQLAFVATSRDHKDEWVKVADTATGAVRDVYTEHVDSYYGWQSQTDWKVLWGSGELLWVSERSDWAQVYLYDLQTGKLKNQVTKGDGPVQDLVSVDEKARVLYFMAGGKVKKVDPYFDMLWRVDLDGKNQKLLTPEVADHQVKAANDSSSFVDTYSTVNMPPVTVLRDNSGKVLATLGKEDITPLLAAGWKAPEPITVKARDGKTKVYGFLWKPTTFDA
ncbi:MAG: DPP IV N-terminal domain-containing protein, partial [Acidobacteriota bacterium]